MEVEAEKGSPQGGVISPLLANIYLNPLDWKIQGPKLRLVRYADDIVVLCQSEQIAEQVHGEIEQWMEQAGLQLHPEKTRREDMSQFNAYFDFLGYRFKRARSGKLMRLVSPKSLKKHRDKIRNLTRRCNAHSMDSIIASLEPIQRGWFGYFKHTKPSELREVDGWIRMRLRSILRKRDGKKRRARDHRCKSYVGEVFN